MQISAKEVQDEARGRRELEAAEGSVAPGPAPASRRAAAVVTQGRAFARQVYRTSREALRLYQLTIYHAAQERTFRRRSLEELQHRQWRKLKRLLDFAYHQVPFYRERFREAGLHPRDVRTRDDLARIPTLTKDDLRQNFPDRLVRGDRTYRPHQLGRSSGSTGESVHFVRPDTMWRRSLYYAVLLRTGGLRNVPVFVLTTPVCTPNSCSLEYDEPDNLVTNTLLQIPRLRHLAGMIGLPSWLPNILVAPDDFMAALARRLSRQPPCIMIADPVYLGAFARYVRRTRRAPPRFAAIITSYELLTASLRELLREVFGCDVYTQYGASELTDIANECEYHRLHVRMDMVLFEALREGRAAAPGELARVIVTDLDNFNMPLIRYDIGDAVRLAGGDCPCGRRTQGIATIEGRVADVMSARDGVVTPLAADEVFHGLPGVAAYQLTQEAEDRYRVSLMPEAGIPVDAAKVVERCRVVLGEGRTYRVELVDQISPRPSNKFRFTHSVLPPAII